MNSDHSEGNRGGNITPSARKPIHSCGEPYQNTNKSMVRYGAPGHDDDSSSSDHELPIGADVVDNVMSKMSRETSPLPIRNKIRTSSFSHGEETDDNTDHSNLEDRNLSSNSRARRRYENDISNILMNRSNNMSFEGRQRFSKRRDVSVVSGEDQSHSQNTSRNFIILLTIVTVLVAALYTKLPNFMSFSNSKEKYTQTENHDSIIFEANMNNLREKYNIDHNSILQLKTGLSTIFSKMDAGSFMFVYNTNTNNFNPVRFDKFVNEVAFTAARYLRNDISSAKHTVVVSSNLDMREHGELITKYRDEVYRSGVLLVKEIEGVPSDLAMAFHYYCDEYEPLVKRSAIFFTLNLANCSNIPDPKSTHHFIEKCLARKWTTVPKENMRPLLTRVVDVIIDVTSVF